MFNKVRSWSNDAPAPIVWLLVLVVLFVWVTIFSSFFWFLKGGFEEVALSFPSYVKETGFKLFGLYFIAVMIYLIVRLVGVIRS